MKTLIDYLKFVFCDIKIKETDNFKYYTLLVIKNKFNLLITYNDFICGYWFDTWTEDLDHSIRFASISNLIKYIWDKNEV